MTTTNDAERDQARAERILRNNVTQDSGHCKQFFANLTQPKIIIIIIIRIMIIITPSS